MARAPAEPEKPATIALFVLGVLFVILAIVYFATPAKDLPGFIPGHQAGLTRHFKESELIQLRDLCLRLVETMSAEEAKNHATN